MVSISEAESAEAAASSALETEIDKAVKAGKGWKEGEREAYLKRVREEDHPMFAESIDVSCNKGTIPLVSVLPCSCPCSMRA